MTFRSFGDSTSSKVKDKLKTIKDDQPIELHGSLHCACNKDDALGYLATHQVWLINFYLQLTNDDELYLSHQQLLNDDETVSVFHLQVAASLL